MDSDCTRDQQRIDNLMREHAGIVARTFERNVELQDTIKNLQREITVWKQAFEKADEQLAALTARAGDGPGELKAAAPKADGSALTLCLIDGDQNTFAPELLALGVQGGKQAAQLLMRGITSDDKAHANTPGARATHQTWTLVFLDRAVVLPALGCTPEQFDAFVQGFSQAFDLFSVVNVGPTRDGADTKIKAYLRTFARMPQVARLVFCGAAERHYRLLFRLLENEGVLSKVSLLRGVGDPPAELASHRLPVLDVRGLFGTAGPVPAEDRGWGEPAAADWGVPRSPSNGSSATTPSERILSPASPPGLPSAGPASPLGAYLATGRRATNAQAPSSPYLDPSLPISKQNPPPCNFFYLARCNKPFDRCQYSHSYTLTDDQMKELRTMAKRSPCMTANRNLVCPNGQNCCLGHECPNGPTCTYLRAGKCKFTGYNMHAHY